MAKYTIVESSTDRITLRVSCSAVQKLLDNWISVKPEVPPDEEDPESMFDKLESFWEQVKNRTPLWVPFSLATGDVDEIQSAYAPRGASRAIGTMTPLTNRRPKELTL